METLAYLGTIITSVVTDLTRTATAGVDGVTTGVMFTCGAVIVLALTYVFSDDNR